MKTRIVVSAIIEKEGKYLFGRKAPGVGPYPDTWHLLGGGVDLENESLEEGLRRELQEEAHLEIKNIAPLIFDEDERPDKNGVMTRYLFHIYHCEPASEDSMKPDDDIARLEWFTKEQIKELPLPDPSQKFFKYLGWL